MIFIPSTSVSVLHGHCLQLLSQDQQFITRRFQEDPYIDVSKAQEQDLNSGILTPESSLLPLLCIRGTQTPGHGLVPVQLGTRLHCRRWAAGETGSFLCIYSCSLMLTLLPKLRLLSDQQRHNKCNLLESSWNHPCLPLPSQYMGKSSSMKLFLSFFLWYL